MALNDPTISISVGSSQWTIQVCPICSALVSKNQFWNTHAEWHEKRGETSE